MFRKCEKCGGPMGAAVGRECDVCKLKRLGAGRRGSSASRGIEADVVSESAAAVVQSGGHRVAGSDVTDVGSEAAVSPDVEAVAVGVAGVSPAEDGLTPGAPCPTCGRPVPMSSTERSRRHRARKKARS